MSIITRLASGRKNPNRVNLYLDGKFAFSLSLDEVVKNSLKKNLDLTPVQINALRQTDDFHRVYAKILNFISYRPRSEFEICSRLHQYQSNDIEGIIALLTDQGYLNDLVFAQWFVASRLTHKTRSPRALRAELARKGIAREIIDQALTRAEDPRDTIKRILSKKLGTTGPLAVSARQKIFAYLLRQGFGWEMVKEVVKTWESE